MPQLADLELEGVALEPPFDPEHTRYTALLSWLEQAVELRASANEGFTLSLEGDDTAPSGVADLDVVVPSSRGVAVEVQNDAGTTRTYRIEFEHDDHLWHHEAAWLAPSPAENEYFGDYLQASPRFVYVNAARRGLVFRREDARFELDVAVEDLFDAAPEWMFEAAISDDALALVAQPLDGEETLYAFERREDDWALVGEHVVAEQGSVRMAGRHVVFVTTAEVRVFRRDADEFLLVESLPSPATEIGFAVRPTYFDAPGVAFDGRTLVVGAPLADLTQDGEVVASCDGLDGCLRDAGAVFVHSMRDDGALSAPETVLPRVPTEGLEFGSAASVSGDFLAVGSARESTARAGVLGPDVTVDGAATLPESGVVFVFERKGGSFTPRAVVKSSAPAAHDYFGDSVLWHGELLLVSAPGHDGAWDRGPEDTSTPDSGGIFAFLRDGSQLSQLGIFKPAPELGAAYPFPDQMRLGGNTLFVASNTATVKVGGGDLPNAGQVFHFR